MEKHLVKIWSEVLAIESREISIHANFFEIGGHSLKATILTSRIKKELAVYMPLVEVFRMPTVKLQAEYIRHSAGGIPTIEDNRLVLLRKGVQENNHLFLIHDGSGEVEGYMDLCHHLSDRVNCWGIRAHGFDGSAPQNLSINHTAAAYIETIKKVQPHPPYSIAGWSLGGTIAFEIVRQMEQMNRDIRFFALVDSPPPQTERFENAGKFTLESETDWIQGCLPGASLKRITRNASGIDRLWAAIAAYLEETGCDVEIIKPLIPGGMLQAIPNVHRLGVKDLIYYLNVIRSLDNARAFYIPPGKINTPIHYFGASQSKDIIKGTWNEYCNCSLKFFQVPGDHFSIFKEPAVVEIAEIFSRETSGTINRL